MKKNFVTFREAAKKLGVPHQTLYYHIRRADRADLPRYSAPRGNGFRYDFAELSTWWDKHNSVTPTE